MGIGVKMANLDCSAYRAGWVIWVETVLRKRHLKYRKDIYGGGITVVQVQKVVRKINRPTSGLFYFMLRKFLQSISFRELLDIDSLS